MLILIKNIHFRNGIRFDACGSFPISDGSGFGKGVIIFVANMSISVHIDNKKRDILIHDTGPSNGLDDTMLTAEKECSINSINNL